jgi:16S rRNA (adenine1518-N6/adenine1519-N6)-dimethyltransferase
MDFSTLPSLSEVVKQHGLLTQKKHSKSLGQNFILDQSLLDRFVRHIPTLEHAQVIEVGPGPGGLTRAILKKNPKHLYAIEQDTQCCSALEPLQAECPNLTIVNADATSISPQECIPEGPIQIIANLPYNVGTHLLIQWLSNVERIDMLTLMFQKEVAERITAKPRTKEYGRLSVLAQLTCTITRIMTVGPRAFTPPPKVASSVIALIPREQKYSSVFLMALGQLTHEAFSKRRKMLRASLVGILGGELETIFTT